MAMSERRDVSDGEIDQRAIGPTSPRRTSSSEELVASDGHHRITRLLLDDLIIRWWAGSDLIKKFEVFETIVELKPKLHSLLFVFVESNCFLTVRLLAICGRWCQPAVHSL